MKNVCCDRVGQKSSCGDIEVEMGEHFLRELNARWMANYSDFGPVEGYISEMVQDTASDRKSYPYNATVVFRTI